jgi:TonB family protein
MSIALLCLLELPHAWAQRAEGGRQPLPLDAKESARLILYQAPPEYPALAKVNYIQGRVRVRLLVSAVGSVVETHVLSGNPLLAAAVLNSVREWRYRPFVAEGASTPFTTMVDIHFTLRERNMDLSPAQAESDFRRQVKPPEVLTRPEKAATKDPPVRLRLLVNAEGKVIDSEIIEGIPSLFERARKSIERWAFRPARWGALCVPWYLDVEVPLDSASSQALVR